MNICPACKKWVGNYREGCCRPVNWNLRIALAGLAASLVLMVF